MKPRRVVLTIELETDVPIKDLKDDLKEFFSPELVQIQANVIKEKK